MDWVTFHKEFRGKRFVHKLTGNRVEKIELFLRLKGNSDSLDLLINNKHPLYLVIDAPGWQNGILTERLSV